MTQRAEPHHDRRFEDPRVEADDSWTPPELGDHTPLDQQPDPERADWMPPPEHRPPSLLGDEPTDDQPVRQDPTATMLPPTDPTAARTTLADPLWPDAEVARFEGRWREVQLGFVDDPRRAAHEAGSLLDEVVARLTQAISDRRQELDTWRDGGGRSDGDDDTESMLGAVRRYRRLMDQLLAVGRPH